MKNLILFLPLVMMLNFSCQPKNSDDSYNNALTENADSMARVDTIISLSPSNRIINQQPQLKIPEDPYGWVDIMAFDTTVMVDMRYATEDNFIKEKIYECGRCFLRKAVAEAVISVHHDLKQQGMGLKFFDCFRPRPFQQKLWNKMPDARYVTNPAKGSMHNRGAAVDLTIVDSTGRELDMGTGFDFFGPKAYHTNTDLPDTILANRQLLKSSMETAGFKSIRTEWWHYSYIKMKGFELSDYLWDCDNYESKN